MRLLSVRSTGVLAPAQGLIEPLEALRPSPPSVAATDLRAMTTGEPNGDHTVAPSGLVWRRLIRRHFCAGSRSR